MLVSLAILLLANRSFAGPASLSGNEITALRSLIATNSEAAGAFDRVRQDANNALQDSPKPIEKIVSEGHLATDPRKVRTKAALPDMDKTLSLAWAWAVTGDQRYLKKGRDFIIAWAQINRPDGDAINETKFAPMIVGYDLLRAEFNEDDRKVADAWFRNKAETLMLREKGFGGNWPCHRLQIAGLVGFTLNDQSLISQAIDGYRKQVAKDIGPNGACSDFYVRDSLHYQLYSVEPLLTLARACERYGEPLFDYHAPNHGSLHDAVDFVVPFAEGRKTHIEFAHSKSHFDTRRAQDGETEYAPHEWGPRASMWMFMSAAWFRPEYGTLASQLAEATGRKFWDWQMVINSVSHLPNFDDSGRNHVSSH
jgi:Alginate lyase